MSPLKELLKKIESKALSLGCLNVEFQDDRKHNLVIINGPRGRRKVFFSKTPSDHRAIANILRDVGHAAREVGNG